MKQVQDQADENVYQLEAPDVSPDDFERRRQARIRFEAPVRVETRIGRLSDLSVGGAFIEMDRPPSPGTVLEVEFELPRARRRARSLAVVRWVRRPTDDGLPAGCGVQFVWSPRGSQDEIRRALAG